MDKKKYKFTFVPFEVSKPRRMMEISLSCSAQIEDFVAEVATVTSTKQQVLLPCSLSSYSFHILSHGSSLSTNCTNSLIIFEMNHPIPKKFFDTRVFNRSFSSSRGCSTVRNYTYSSIKPAGEEQEEGGNGAEGGEGAEAR
eukprot:Rmarinus@m.18039